MDKESKHTEHVGGWPRFRRFKRMREAWLVLMGRFSLHRAWQSGYDQHAVDDGKRRMKGGQ